MEKLFVRVSHRARCLILSVLFDVKSQSRLSEASHGGAGGVPPSILLPAAWRDSRGPTPAPCFAWASWDSTLSDGSLLSLSSLADNAATAKLLKRATRNFTSSVSDSRDRSIKPPVCVCACTCECVCECVLPYVVVEDACEHTSKAPQH